jgi:hypothetical protein
MHPYGRKPVTIAKKKKKKKKIVINKEIYGKKKD